LIAFVNADGSAVFGIRNDSKYAPVPPGSVHAAPDGSDKFSVVVDGRLLPDTLHVAEPAFTANAGTAIDTVAAKPTATTAAPAPTDFNTDLRIQVLLWGV
jgi:hypothetical protein